MTAGALAGPPMRGGLKDRHQGPPSVPFVHLHVHSDYSLLSATARVTELPRCAAVLGQPAIALTDSDVMHGAVEFQRACDDQEIKAIHGLDLGVVRRSALNAGTGDPARLVLLAETDQGLQNLFSLSSLVQSRGGDARSVAVEFDRIAEFADGLIALTGSRQTALGRCLADRRADEARLELRRLLEIFGPAAVYVQLEQCGLRDEDRVLWGVLGLAREFGVAPVATNDVRYLHQDDRAGFEATVAGVRGATLDEVGEELASDRRWLTSGDEMAAAHPLFSEALEQTLKIAERCCARLSFRPGRPPHFTGPNGEPGRLFLRFIAEQGLHDRFGDSPSAATKDRLGSELAAIEERGAEPYFLSLWDAVSFARLNDIPVGPGRGAAACSLVNYCLRVTEINPIAYGLYFERLFPSRPDALPDVDIDFGVDGRQRVVEHLVERHGADRVAQVVTFSRRFPRAAIRQAATVVGESRGTADWLAGKVPDPVGGRHLTIGEYVSREPELRRLHAEDEVARTLLDTAVGLEDRTCSRHVHACAVAIGDRPLGGLAPLQIIDDGCGARTRVTQYSRRALEQTGVVVFDVLGLRALDLLRATLEEIERSTGKRPDVDSIPLDDDAVFAMLRRGDTRDVFHLAGEQSRDALAVIHADRFTDLAAVVALTRPHALSLLGPCARNKSAPDTAEFPDGRMRSILANTYGVVVYQEQVMHLLIELAGFSTRDADQARRALGKKRLDQTIRERDRFSAGAVARGLAAELLDHVWVDWIEKPIDYAFNFSHALCYALIAYRHAWLKHHFPGEFLAALDKQERQEGD